MLNTLEIAWASIVLLIAGVDTGGEDAAEVEAGVVCTGNHAHMGRDVERLFFLFFFFLGGGGGIAFLLLFVQHLMLTGDEHSH